MQGKADDAPNTPSFREIGLSETGKAHYRVEDLQQKIIGSL
jgi:hypothetical protein